MNAAAVVVHARRAVAAPLTAALVLALAAAAQAPADPPPADHAPPRLVLLPPAIQLDDLRDHQRAVLLAVGDDEVTQDLTPAAQFALADPALAALEVAAGTVVLRPRRDGDTELIARHGGREVRVPVRVRHAAVDPPVSFRNEVVPALTRSGCNAGSCHGAAAGKNGFRLSLFGYAPARDHDVLTRELRGRRLDFACPERSLVLQKATAAVTHQGGKRFPADGTRYRTLRAWIDAGAADDGDAAPALQAIDVLPDSAVLVGAGAELPLLLRARYADGTDRDVTSLALWSSNNDGSVAVGPDGRLRAGQRGEAAVLARFGGLAVAARVLVHADDKPFTWPAVAAANFVDEQVHAKLRRARTLPAPAAGDAVFLRRVYLDLLGILPTVAEARAFLDDEAADKRDRLVDALLERPEFADVQAMAWAEVLQVDEETMQKKGAALLGRWLRDAFAQHRPLSDTVHELLTASGPTFANPPANLQLIAGQPHLVAERVAQVFLGVRLQCAQCHNHPFERWTMDDYYGFAAFFGQVGRKRGLDPDESVIWDRRTGDVRNQRDGSVAAPRLLGGGVVAIPAGQDRRQVLADWLVAAGNPFFARNVVNRVWARLFGRGLVEPVDDVRVGNPASHPALLDALAALFVDKGFDVRPVVAAICKSRTYQRTRAPAGTDPALFAGQEPRRLPAEPLLDAISMVTGAPTKYPGLPLGSPASAIDGGRAGVRFLEAFGRPARTSACTCERSNAPTLGQTLHLINGDTVADKIADGKGRLRAALAGKQAPEAMLEELFLAAYSRRPTAAERERLLRCVAEAGDARAAWEDVYWSVLNSNEFLFQH